MTPQAGPFAEIRASRLQSWFAFVVVFNKNQASDLPDFVALVEAIEASLAEEDWPSEDLFETLLPVKYVHRG